MLEGNYDLSIINVNSVLAHKELVLEGKVIVG